MGDTMEDAIMTDKTQSHLIEQTDIVVVYLPHRNKWEAYSSKFDYGVYGKTREQALERLKESLDDIDHTLHQRWRDNVTTAGALRKRFGSMASENSSATNKEPV